MGQKVSAGRGNMNAAFIYNDNGPVGLTLRSPQDQRDLCFCLKTAPGAQVLSLPDFSLEMQTCKVWELCQFMQKLV